MEPYSAAGNQIIGDHSLRIKRLVLVGHGRTQAPSLLAISSVLLVLHRNLVLQIALDFQLSQNQTPAVLNMAIVKSLLLASIVSCTLYCQTNSSKWLLSAIWLAVEAAFAQYFRKRAKQLCATSGQLDLNDHDGLDLMRKCLSKLHFTPDYLTAWFLDAKLHHIRLGNLRALMAYGFWYKSYDELSKQDKAIIQAAIKQMEHQTGLFLDEGYNPNIHFMSHLWDALCVSYKPLTFYIFTECIARVTHVILITCGFTQHTVGGSVFYTLNFNRVEGGAASSGYNNGRGAADQTPILFVHGVGLGLFPYLGLVYKLAATGRPLILPHYQHIAMRLSTTIPTVHQCAESAAAFLAALNMPQVHMMGHSYGTLVCARLSRSHRHLVSSLVLLDPVCFSMYMPTLLYNFLYAQTPKPGSSFIPRIMNQLLLLVSRELHCATTFCRNFLWSEYNLWPDCLPPRTLVALSDGNVLVAPEVQHQLKVHSNATLVYHPTMPHAAMLLLPNYMDMLLHSWEKMLGETSAAPFVSAAPAAEATPQTRQHMAPAAVKVAHTAAPLCQTIADSKATTAVAAAAAAAAVAAAAAANAAAAAATAATDAAISSVTLSRHTYAFLQLDQMQSEVYNTVEPAGIKFDAHRRKALTLRFAVNARGSCTGGCSCNCTSCQQCTAGYSEQLSAVFSDCILKRENDQW